MGGGCGRRLCFFTVSLARALLLPRLVLGIGGVRAVAFGGAVLPTLMRYRRSRPLMNGVFSRFTLCARGNWAV